MPTAAPATKKRKKKPAPKQLQVKHRWAYLVLWYEEIRRHTRTDFGSIQPIAFETIKAYRDLFVLEMEPWEVDILMKVDLVWRTSLPKDKPRPKK